MTNKKFRAQTARKLRNFGADFASSHQLAKRIAQQNYPTIWDLVHAGVDKIGKYDYYDDGDCLSVVTISGKDYPFAKIGNYLT